jgi:hypothetical protein
MCGVLARAIRDGILSRYYLKGGVAMELRFAGAARATKDLDLGLDGDRAYRLSSFAAALGLGFDDFTFRLRPQLRHMELADCQGRSDPVPGWDSHPLWTSAFSRRTTQ